MSNDNNTLADAQPGGMVRLATVPYDRARDLIGDAYNAGTHGIGYSQQAMELHDAIIPAHPTPGGQGDARIPFETWAKDGGFDVSKFKGIYNSLETRTAWEAWLYWQRLAARQPVGWQPMESAPKDGTVVLGLLEGSDIPQSIRFRDGWEIAWDGYRIPAHDGPLRWAPLYSATPAQQPAQVYLDGLDRALGEAIDQRDRYHEVADDLAGHIAAITGVDIGEHSSANCPWQNAIEAAEEYKPAQAVDLARWSQRHADDLHLAVHTALSVHAGSLSQKKRAAISAYVKRLLIDSQAVGK